MKTISDKLQPSSTVKYSPFNQPPTSTRRRWLLIIMQLLLLIAIVCGITGAAIQLTRDEV